MNNTKVTVRDLSTIVNDIAGQMQRLTERLNNLERRVQVDSKTVVKCDTEFHKRHLSKK